MITVSELANFLKGSEKSLRFESNPSFSLEVPDHFHVTEVGRMDKQYMDCGGVLRMEEFCIIQVWSAHDVEHRLTSSKFLKILDMADATFDLAGLSIRIEYGEKVASQYVLSAVREEGEFLWLFLEARKTDCLAPDKCGVSSCCEEGCC